MAVELKGIRQNGSDLKKFVQFPIDYLYQDSKCYVPALVMDEVNTLLPQKNPAFEFCESKYFMTYRDGKPVGRIAAIINRKVNERTGKHIMRFGFVDFIDDNEVVDTLFNAVIAWAKEKGMTELQGPLGFTDMDREGMLTYGYDRVSTMATIYNYPYYITQLERIGLVKDAEWVEFRIKIPKVMPDKFLRIADIVTKKFEVKNVHFDSKKELVARYGQEMFRLINEAYDQLFGYSPLSPRQIDHYLKMYIPIVRLENISVVVDKDDNLVGVGLVMPSLSEALIKCRGRLMPLGWYHLLKSLKGRNEVVDLLLIAVKPDYQSKGVNSLIFNDLVPVFNKSGYKEAETNPELNVNQKVQAQWQYFENEMHKRRNSFKKEI